MKPKESVLKRAAEKELHRYLVEWKTSDGPEAAMLFWAEALDHAEEQWSSAVEGWEEVPELVRVWKCSLEYGEKGNCHD